jgi:hypothetical protein
MEHCYASKNLSRQQYMIYDFLSARTLPFHYKSCFIPVNEPSETFTEDALPQLQYYMVDKSHIADEKGPGRELNPGPPPDGAILEP